MPRGGCQHSREAGTLRPGFLWKGWVVSESRQKIWGCLEEALDTCTRNKVRAVGLGPLQQGLEFELPLGMEGT